MTDVVLAEHIDGYKNRSYTIIKVDYNTKDIIQRLDLDSDQFLKLYKKMGEVGE